MNKKENLLKEQNCEMFSLNESVFEVFSVEELEQRLQMSAAKPWGCSSDCNGYIECCNPSCTAHGLPSDPPPPVDPVNT